MTTRVLGTRWEGVRHGAARVARRRNEDGERFTAAVQRGHQARHHARADVLEREGRTMKQLEREDARLDLDERIGKFNASTTTASSVAGSISPRVNGRNARRPISVRVRRGSRAKLGGGPTVRPFRACRARRPAQGLR